MKYNQRLQNEIEKFKDYIMIVEGKKDVNALKSLGFQKVYALHIPSIPIRERVEQIMLLINKKEKICILTDLDKKGRQLYEKLKPIFQELGAHLDSSFRGILIKTKLSHIEGLFRFMEKIESLR